MKLRLRGYTSSLAGAVLVLDLISSAPGGCGHMWNGATTKSTQLATMTASILHKGTDVCVEISITNVGSAPIVVDKYLIFCIYIEPTCDDGRPMEWSESSEVERDIALGARPRERYVSVGPGAVLKRVVWVGQELRVFEAAQGSFMSSGGRVSHRPSGVEVIRRGSKPMDLSAIESIKVRYEDWSVNRILQNALSIYVGVRPRDVGLFRGPLEATVRVSR